MAIEKKTKMFPNIGFPTDALQEDQTVFLKKTGFSPVYHDSLLFSSIQPLTFSD